MNKYFIVEIFWGEWYWWMCRESRPRTPKYLH